MTSVFESREPHRLRPLYAVVCWACLGLAGGMTFADAAKPTKTPVNSPLSTGEAQQRFVVHPEIQIELAAAEPLVIDPVAIAFDEDGRLWVVEMRDYPHGPAEGESPKSRISILQDRDGDGQFESAQVFADGLLFATGLQPWRGGVIATVAGEVIYLKDTDGDGRADSRETWFSGFTQQNSQLRANHPTFALDNQIYVANGLRGGTVSTKRPQWKSADKPISISGMDFRFDPLRGNPQAVSGAGQFGLTFDDFGNRFICSNRNPCMHVVLANHDLTRNPYLAVGSVVQDVSPAGAASRVFPLSKFWTTSTLHEGQFTAACGVTIYRGDAFPQDFRGNSFTCEPTGNLVHRDVLTADGATFNSRPGRDGQEFLASPDTWFRPVNLTVGPDGALYVVDMYRAVIEHPQWMPAELQDRRDLLFGNDRGRIWRLIPKAGKRDQQRPNLSSATSAELVSALEHDNAWWRETAQRLLIERQDRSAKASLEQICEQSLKPTSVIHALWTLQGLGILTDATIASALQSRLPRVREQALRLADSRMKGLPKLDKQVLKLASDPDPRVRFRAALNLGTRDVDEQVMAALLNVLVAGHNDRWTRNAVYTALSDNAHIMCTRLWSSPLQPRQAATPIRELSVLVGARRQPAEIGAVLQNLDAPSASAANIDDLLLPASLIRGLGEGLARRGARFSEELRKLPPEFDLEKSKVDAVFERAARIAADPGQGVAARIAATELLSYAEFVIARPVLAQLYAGDVPQELRTTVVDVLAGFRDESIGGVLLGGYREQTPAVRRRVLAALLQTVPRINQLLDEIEAGDIAVLELGATNVNRLIAHKNAAVKQRAAKLLAAAIPAQRGEVLAKYQPVLEMDADPSRGRKLFEKNCSTCHRIGDIGVEIGPDIADSRTRQPAALLTDILNPNRAIDANYVSYTVFTNRGKTITGIIAAETASSVIIKQAEDKRVTVLRQDIEEIVSNGVSLMPEGLEKNLNLQQMADLIAFIKNWRYLDGSVPLRGR